ncbi:hypothetical protein [Actinophytocola sp.]|uniref:hypothetical protein n=1 Tax=Actinophytocola sp. TaxID=1872138 RepID=UPI003D6AA4C9
MTIFALSGYLITGVLTTDLTTTGRVDYRRFHLRRARRLLPALSTVNGVSRSTTRTASPTTRSATVTWNGRSSVSRARSSART